MVVVTEWYYLYRENFCSVHSIRPNYMLIPSNPQTLYAAPLTCSNNPWKLLHGECYSHLKISLYSCDPRLCKSIDEYSPPNSSMIQVLKFPGALRSKSNDLVNLNLELDASELPPCVFCRCAVMNEGQHQRIRLVARDMVQG